MDRQKWSTFFTFTPLVIENAEYGVLPEDLADVRHTSYRWHREGDPSSWLAVLIFHTVRKKYPKLAERKQLEVAAHALGVTFKRLVDAIEWRDNYLAFKDGAAEKTLKGKY